MPPKHRKKPFSAKQKKEQLQVKREKKRTQETDEFGAVPRRGAASASHGDDLQGHSDSDDAETAEVRKINQQPGGMKADKYDPNRYRLHFAKESQAEVEKRKRESQKPFEVLPEESLEVDIDDIYRPGTVLDMPKRPSWNYNMSKAALNSKEEAYFKGYLDEILKTHKDEELSYFELNLETWRQLWRVLEISDVMLLITDIRHPALHFSPAFYQYVTGELKKPLILVLNKVDLAPPALVVAWQHYFTEKFPDVKVVCFTSFPREKASEATADPGKVFHKRRKRRVFAAAGPKQLLNACEEIVKGQVDLSSWREKIEGDIAGVESSHQVEIRMEEAAEDNKHVLYRDGVLTIGCCGYPNVGKSSLMNGLMGKKVVSVSKTPGHTKHFQTIYLTPTVKLCDSPGLVFPSLVPKPMQILAGIYPIAQVREPYSAVGFLAQRLPLVSLLRITPTDGGKPDGKEVKWSAYDICDAWAEKRGFLTAKASRPDLYRAANHILRLAVDGRLCLCTRPPGFTKQKDDWELHKDTTRLTELLDTHGTHPPAPGDLSSSEPGSSDSGSDEEQDSGSGEEATSSGRSLAVNNPFALLGDE